MYRVEVDGHTIHDPRDEHFILPYAKLDLELNKTGSFELDITTENPGYEYVSPMKSVISVYDDGKLIFRGRSTTEEKDFYNTGTLKCEGELSYFVDTILRPRSSAFIRQTNRYIFSEVVKEHNNQVGADKQFQPGIIDVDKEEISSISFNYEKPLDFINKNLIEKYKGYLRIRYADGKRYLDWVKQYGDLSGQEIRFGYNLLDLKKTLVSTDVCTMVVPVGGSDKKVTVQNAVVGGKTYGKDYIQNDEAVNYFGKIIKMQEFPDKKSPNELYAEGEKWLLENMKSSLTVELTALDLHMVDVNIDDFKLGDLVKVVSVPHSIVFKDDLPVIEKYSYDITDPSKNTITVGKTLKVFTERKDPVIYDKVQEVTGRFEGYVETTDGKIEEITNEIQEFKTLVIQDFTAVNGSIEQLTSKQADFETATAENFISTNAEISNLSGDFVSFKTGEFDSLKTKQADFETATAEHFTALQAQIDSLDVGNLDAKYATIENLNAANATITTLTGDLADYKKITTENLSSTTGKIDTLTGDLADYKKLMADELLAAKGWMAEGSIGSAQISDLTANKIRGGTLDTSLVTVAGSDGKLQISDNTMQIKDSSRVRVQVGKDEGGDYTLAVWDKNGKLIWDALGATENTIQRKIIRDNVVADNANIQGSKLDINSVIRSVNGATEKISSTVVNVGDKSLKILLEEQSNTITEQGKTLTSHGTQIKANQDSINLKVSGQEFNTYKTTVSGDIEEAKNAAIGTASTDATTKANNAKSAAVTAAAADAKTKADKALADSKSYTSTQITTVNEHLSTIDASITVLQNSITLKAEQTDIDTAITTVNKKFASYSTITQMNSAIELSKTGILSTVSSTYSTKTETNVAKTAADAAKTAADTANSKFASYSTTTQMNSAISQKADSILSTVSGTYTTKTDTEAKVNSLKASLELKINKDSLVSEINASADIINLRGNRFIVDSDNFKLTANGTLTAKNGIFSGSLDGATGSFSGNITAETGIIGPWNFDNSSIWKGNSSFGNTSGMYFGTDGLSISDKFKITNTGSLIATDVYLNGTFSDLNENIIDFTTTINTDGIKISDKEGYCSLITPQYLTVFKEEEEGVYDNVCVHITRDSIYTSRIDFPIAPKNGQDPVTNGVYIDCYGFHLDELVFNPDHMSTHYSTDITNEGIYTTKDICLEDTNYLIGSGKHLIRWTGSEVGVGDTTAVTGIWGTKLLMHCNIQLNPNDSTKYLNTSGNARLGYLTMDGNIALQDHNMNVTGEHGLYSNTMSNYIVRYYISGSTKSTALGNNSYQTRIYGSSVWANKAISTSDERIKESFSSLQQYEDIFMSLNPTAYQFLEGYEPTKLTHFGFRAQQIRKAFSKRNLDPSYYALNGETSVDAKDYNERMGINPDYETEYGICYEEMIALNTHMIQKNRKDMNNQISRIDMHESIINDLQSRLWKAEKQIKELKQTAQ